MRCFFASLIFAFIPLCSHFIFHHPHPPPPFSHDSNPGAYDTTTASFPMKQFRAGTEGGGGSPGTPRGTWRPRDTMGDGTGTPRSTFTPRGTVSPADFGATMTMTIDPEKLRQMGDEAVAEFQSIRLPVINDDGWSAPPIVFVCVEWMMAKGLNEEGVFRIPASKTKINALLREVRCVVVLFFGRGAAGSRNWELAP